MQEPFAPVPKTAILGDIFPFSPFERRVRHTEITVSPRRLSRRPRRGPDVPLGLRVVWDGHAQFIECRADRNENGTDT